MRPCMASRLEIAFMTRLLRCGVATRKIGTALLFSSGESKEKVGIDFWASLHSYGVRVMIIPTL